jgi:hypothetical protein
MRASFASVDLTWLAGPVSVHCCLPKGLCVALNDLSGNNYRKVTSLSIPKLVLRFLHSLGERNDWVEAGEVVFDVALDSYSSPPGWQESALSQAEFLADQDGPTGRLRKLRIGLGKRGRWALREIFFSTLYVVFCKLTVKYSAECPCCCFETTKTSSCPALHSSPGCSTGRG